MAGAQTPGARLLRGRDFAVVEQRVCIVGAGAVGSSLAMRLEQRGHEVSTVISRSSASAEGLASRLRSASASTSLNDVSTDPHWVFLCVSDDVLPEVADGLSEARFDSKEVLIAHTSGRHSIDVLRPLEREGVGVLGFHPLQTFPRRFDPGAFEGCYVGIEGSDDILAPSSALADTLGMQVVRVASADKPAYHLAASLASNFLITLLSGVSTLAQMRSEPSNWTAEAFEPLMRRTLENAMTARPDEVLTGPIARGDVSTVLAHLAEVERMGAGWKEIYVAMGRETARIASNQGMISVDEGKILTQLLENHARAGQ